MTREELENKLIDIMIEQGGGETAAFVIADFIDNLMEKNSGTVFIGDLIIRQTENHTWINRTDGEGMEVGVKSMELLHSVLEGFYDKEF